MPRPEKVQAVAEIKERIERAQAVFLAEYAGLSVKDQQALRRSLREGGAEFKVVKMTLARRAADDLDLERVSELLLGPTGLTFADGDPVTAAKALKDFAKDHEVFVVKGGMLGGDFLTPERVSELADIEPRDVLLARIAGAAKAPMANFAGLLAAMPRNLASMLQQLVDKKESDEAPVPADATPTEDEAPAVEEAAAGDAAAEGSTPGGAIEAAVEDTPTDEADEDAAPEAEAEADDADASDDTEPVSDAEASDAGDEEDDTSDADASDEEE